MKLKFTAACIGFLVIGIAPGNAAAPSVIPLPQKLTLQAGSCELTAATRVYADAAARPTADILTERLRPATGYPLKIRTQVSGRAAMPGGIYLTLKSADTNLGPEGYMLSVAPDAIMIRAATTAGLFYGVQTLLQLLPPEIFATNQVSQVAWQIPCVQIEDWPRFAWRGFMLDVSRHFFNKSEVKTFLDAMALHKMNVFHWHLTDDHGWRIQINKYPRLTQESFLVK